MAQTRLPRIRRAYAAYANLAWVFWERGERGLAIDHVRRSLEIEEAAESHFTLGTFLEAEGQTKEAGWHFRRALDLEPFWA